MRRLTVLLLFTALLLLAGPSAVGASGSPSGSWMRSEDMLVVRIAAGGSRLTARVPAAQASAKLGCRYPRGFHLLALRFRYVRRHGHRVRVARGYTGTLRDFPAGAPGCLTMRWRVRAQISRRLDVLTVRQTGVRDGFVFHFVRRG